MMQEIGEKMACIRDHLYFIVYSKLNKRTYLHPCYLACIIILSLNKATYIHKMQPFTLKEVLFFVFLSRHLPTLPAFNKAQNRGHI